MKNMIIIDVLEKIVQLKIYVGQEANYRSRFRPGHTGAYRSKGNTVVYQIATLEPPILKNEQFRLIYSVNDVGFRLFLYKLRACSRVSWHVDPTGK